MCHQPLEYFMSSILISRNENQFFFGEESFLSVSSDQIFCILDSVHIFFLCTRRKIAFSFSVSVTVI